MRRGPTVQIKNVFSDRLNREHDKLAFRKSDGKLFHMLVAAAAKVLSPKQVDVRWTDSVLVSAERSCLARASVTSWQSSARYPGAPAWLCWSWVSDFDLMYAFFQSHFLDVDGFNFVPCRRSSVHCCVVITVKCCYVSQNIKIKYHDNADNRETEFEEQWDNDTIVIIISIKFLLLRLHAAWITFAYP